MLEINSYSINLKELHLLKVYFSKKKIERFFSSIFKEKNPK